MNKELTEIAYILDRSGSMESLKEAAIAGFNNFLKTQQENEGQANLSLVLFDNEYILHHDGQNIQNVHPIDTNIYIPRGMTALLDSIGRTIDNIGTRLAKTPEEQRPGKVIICIFTDGYENASTDYSIEKINQMIKLQRDTYNWDILFLSATEDALRTAQAYGINQHDASMIYNTKKGVEASAAAFSKKASAIRNSTRGTATNEDERILKYQFSQVFEEEHDRID